MFGNEKYVKVKRNKQTRTWQIFAADATDLSAAKPIGETASLVLQDVELCCEYKARSKTPCDGEWEGYAKGRLATGDPPPRKSELMTLRFSQNIFVAGNGNLIKCVSAVKRAFFGADGKSTAEVFES